MKRTLATAALAVLALTFSACGTDNNNNSEQLEACQTAVGLYGDAVILALDLGDAKAELHTNGNPVKSLADLERLTERWETLEGPLREAVTACEGA